MNRMIVLPLTFSALLASNLSGAFASPAEDQTAYMANVKKAEALFKERCATVAGEKIYKTVENVEGILLLRVRPERGDKEWRNPMWPGAAFASEFAGSGYIMSFLPYRAASAGYRWVDAIDEKDGRRYRYTGSNKAIRKQDITAYNVQLAMRKDPSYDLNVYQWTLDKSPAPRDLPRYAVTYEDHVISEERDVWIASGTIKVIDLKTQDVLGELTRYAISHVHTSSGINPAPWLTSSICPMVDGDYTKSTRIFTHKVLIPAKEK